MSKPKLVVLTGAGISAESGLRTFRDSGGLWEGYNIEDVATASAWTKNPRLVLEFYNFRRQNVLDARPNTAHFGFAALEQDFDVQIVTQNVDDLHERAGSTSVLHLHGEILKMRSVKNSYKTYPITGDIHLGDLAADGGQLRPDIVWFEEPVPLMDKAAFLMQQAEIFVLVGSSLLVYPAAGLLDYVKPEVTKYVIDRKIPPVHYYDNIIPIEKPATEGIADLLRLLRG
jgi:NAD-dependent deacetylase